MLLYHDTSGVKWYGMLQKPKSSLPCAIDSSHIIMQDRSFTFILKTPPASVLLAKAAGVPKGSGNPKTEKVGKISQAQLKVCCMVVKLHSDDHQSTIISPQLWSRSPMASLIDNSTLCFKLAIA